MVAVKVVLISPVDDYLQDAGDRPALGLAYLAGYARENGFDDIEIVDLNHETEIPEADLYGITAVTPAFSNALTIAKNLKAKYKKPVILGGPHASAVPRTIPIFDKIIVGEGEKSFLKVLKGESTMRIVASPLIQDLDEIPMPAWDLLPMKKYNLKLDGEPATSLITSRGCPFGCVYCGKQVYGRTWRGHSAKRVIAEMQFLKDKYGIESFVIYDDTFTLKKSRIYEMQELMKQEKMDWVKFRCTTRADQVDIDLLKALKEMGCMEICYGVESGNDEILKASHKGMTTSQNERAIRLTKKYGMKTKAYFIVGLPFETKKTVLQTLRFAKRANPDFADFYILAPYPGSELFQNPSQFGMTVEKDCNWRYIQAGREEPTPRIYDNNLGKYERLELYRQVKAEWNKYVEERKAKEVLA